MILETLELSEKIKFYLNTKEGRKFFRQITPNMSRAGRFEFKKSLGNPPEYILRRAEAVALLDAKIKHNKCQEKLDKDNPI